MSPCSCGPCGQLHTTPYFTVREAIYRTNDVISSGKSPVYRAMAALSAPRMRRVHVRYPQKWYRRSKHVLQDTAAKEQKESPPRTDEGSPAMPAVTVAPSPHNDGLGPAPDADPNPNPNPNPGIPVGHGVLSPPQGKT